MFNKHFEIRRITFQTLRQTRTAWSVSKKAEPVMGATTTIAMGAAALLPPILSIFSYQQVPFQTIQ